MTDDEFDLEYQRLVDLMKGLYQEGEAPETGAFWLLTAGDPLLSVQGTILLSDHPEWDSKAFEEEFRTRNNGTDPALTMVITWWPPK